MATEKQLIELAEALRMIQNSKEDCPEPSIMGRAIWNTAHMCALSCLNSCLTVEGVEVIHGKWIDKKYWKNKIFYHSKECSNCHYSFTPRIDYNYCPQCGSKMDGVQE